MELLDRLNAVVIISMHMKEQYYNEEFYNNITIQELYEFQEINAVFRNVDVCFIFNNIGLESLHSFIQH